MADAVTTLTKDAIDVSDLWRAQVVLAVSALDQFVHESTRLGMIEAAKGSRPKTDTYLRFDVPMAATESALSGITCRNEVDSGRTGPTEISLRLAASVTSVIGKNVAYGAKPSKPVPSV